MTIFITIINSLALAFFLAAIGRCFRLLRNPALSKTAISALIIALAMLCLACFSNILEHGFATNSLEKLEDICRIIFTLLIVFFIFTYRAKQAMRAIKESEEWLRFTFAAIGDGVIITDKSGNVRMINQAMLNMTGWEHHNCIGLPVSQVMKFTSQITGESLSYNPFSVALVEQRVVKLPENTIIQKDGVGTLLIAHSAVPILAETGESIGAAMVIRDIEREVNLHRQLVHAQKMEAVGQLAGGIAHDFNNMLGGIMGAAELLKMKLASGKTDGMNELVNIIQNASSKAADLTSKLLTFSRKGNYVFKTFDLHQVIHEASLLLERSIDKRISLKLNLGSHPLMVRGDSSQLESVFINLGINARDAMPDGGQIIISSKNVFLDQEWCDNLATNLGSGNYAMVSIQDSGTGIPPEIQSKIFEPFFTTKEFGKGTGLGLASVYGTIDSHRGAVTFYTEQGHGTVFNVYLPLEISEKQANESTERKLATGTGTILLIDDDENICFTTREILTASGYKVFIAKDGREGVSLFQQHCRKIDLVLLDVIMPQLLGPDVLAKIREINSGIKVIMASGFAADDKITSCQCDFIKKPYHFNELLQLIKKNLETDD